MKVLLPVAIIAALSFSCGCSNHHKSDQMASGEGATSKETPVLMADLPPAVRAALERESVGGKVMEVEKEMKDGKTVYSADVVIKGQTWDITVDEAGKVIKKEMEKNAYEKDKTVK